MPTFAILPTQVETMPCPNDPDREADGGDRDKRALVQRLVLAAARFHMVCGLSKQPGSNMSVCDQESDVIMPSWTRAACRPRTTMLVGAKLIVSTCEAGEVPAPEACMVNKMKMMCSWGGVGSCGGKFSGATLTASIWGSAPVSANQSGSTSGRPRR
jgi:hypothetical protein